MLPHALEPTVRKERKRFLHGARQRGCPDICTDDEDDGGARPVKYSRGVGNDAIAEHIFAQLDALVDVWPDGYAEELSPEAPSWTSLDMKRYFARPMRHATLHREPMLFKVQLERYVRFHNGSTCKCTFMDQRTRSFSPPVQVCRADLLFNPTYEECWRGAEAEMHKQLHGDHAHSIRIPA